MTIDDPKATSFPDLPGFELQMVLGEGSFGTVYLATDDSEGEFALKVLKRRTTSNGGAEPGDDHLLLDLFKREIVALRNSPMAGVVPIYADHLSNQPPFYVMKLMPDGSLEEYLRSLPQAPYHGMRLRLLRMLADAATTLAGVHGRLGPHLDLKPANLLVELEADRTTAFLSDYGAARAHQVLPQGSVMGTPGYLSPERRSGSNGVSADVYALGGILYRIMTAVDPPPDDQRSDSRFSLEFPVGIHPDDIAVACKCLSMDPLDRYESASAVAAELHRLIAGQEVEARPLSTGVRLFRWAKRHVAVLAPACVALFVLALAAVREVERRNAESGRRVEEAKRDRRQRYEDCMSFVRHADWSTALEAIERELRDPLPEWRVPLEIARIRGLLVTANRVRATALIDAMSRRTDLGSHIATVQLLQADLALSDMGAQVEGRKLLDLALSRKKDLEPADAAYAEALAAPSSSQCIAKLEHAIALDRLHHRARAGLAAARLCRGEIDVARTEAGFLRQLFPDDPLPVCIEIVADVLEDRRADAERRVEEVARSGRPPLSSERIRDLRAFVGSFSEAIHAIEDLACDGPMDLLALSRRLAAVTAPAKWSTLGDEIGVSIPTIRWMLEPLPVLIGALTRQMLGAAPPQKELEAALANHPDGHLQGILAEMHLMASARAFSRGDKAKAAEELELTSDLGKRANSAAWLRPNGVAHYRALLVWFIADAFLATPEFPNRDKELRRRRLSDAAIAVVQKGRRFPNLRRDLLDKYRIAEVLAYSPESARLLLATWRTEAVPEPAPFALSAELEARLGNFELAAEYAARVQKWKGSKSDEAQTFRKRMEAVRRAAKEKVALPRL